MRVSLPWLTVPAGLVGAGMATAAYAVLYERNRWTLRRFEVAALAPGSAPFTILHLSDLHMTAAQLSKQRWVRALDELDPDLVITTGDNLAGHDAVGPTLSALGPLLDRPGAFVPGSNDYWAPRPKNPLRYFKADDERILGEPLPWPDLRDAMSAAGWLDLTNCRGSLRLGERTIAFAGLDDPHTNRDRYDRIAGRADRDADLRIGLVHSPEPALVDRFARDGYELVLAGHTHGGQLRVPFYGALVTNCGISRRQSRWLSRWTPASSDLPGTWLHVSAGLGTSPYAPFRFACPPEATVLTLVPRLR